MAGINLSESLRTSMISKLSWLSVLDDFFTFSDSMPFCLELLDRRHDFDPLFVICVAGNYLLRPPVLFSRFVAKGRVIWLYWNLEDLCHWHWSHSCCLLSPHGVFIILNSLCCSKRGRSRLADPPIDVGDSVSVNKWWSWHSPLESDSKSVPIHLFHEWLSSRCPFSFAKT